MLLVPCLLGRLAHKLGTQLPQLALNCCLDLCKGRAWMRFPPIAQLSADGVRLGVGGSVHGISFCLLATNLHCTPTSASDSTSPQNFKGHPSE